MRMCFQEIAHSVAKRNNLARHIALAAALVLMICSCSTNVPKLMVSVLAVDFSSTGDEVAGLLFGERVLTQDLLTGEERCSWDADPYTYVIQYSTQGNLLAMEYRGKSRMEVMLSAAAHFIALYETETCELVQEIPVRFRDYAATMSFSHDDKYLVVGTVASVGEGDNLQVIDIEAGEISRAWTFEDARILTSTFSQDGSLLLFGLMDFNSSSANSDTQPSVHSGRAVLMDFTTGKIVNEWNEPTSRGITAVAISNDGKSIALGFYDGTVKVVDRQSNESIVVHKHLSLVETVVFSRDGKTVFSGSWDETVVANEVATGNTVQEFDFASAVKDFDISPDGMKIAVGLQSASTLEFRDLGS